MPITLHTPALGRWIGALLLAATIASPLTAMSPGVAVLRATPWSPGDAVREGAGEFEVLVCAARLQREHAVAGLIGVGDRHGLFLQGAERALRHLTLTGVPVAKLANGGDLASDPDSLFLDATGLSETQASAVLKKCLERHGPPPSAKNPSKPTTQEIAAVRAHLEPFREAFAFAGAPRVAVK